MVVETSKGKLPVRYGWNALAKFGDLTELTMDEILELDMKKMKMSDLLKFVYVGFVEGARKEGVECVFKSPEDVGDLIDDEPDIITKVMEAFNDMSAVGGEGSKKK